MSKDNDVYRFIVRYKIAHQGNSPSFEEIMEGCNISSKSMVSHILASLQDAGLLVQDGVKNISIPNSKWTVEEV
jgi:SOS-response transcriptional repressor LexA